MVQLLPALLPLFIAIEGVAAAVSISLLLMVWLMLVSLGVLLPMWIAGHEAMTGCVYLLQRVGGCAWYGLDSRAQD